VIRKRILVQVLACWNSLHTTARTSSVRSVIKMKDLNIPKLSATSFRVMVSVLVEEYCQSLDTDLYSLYAAIHAGYRSYCPSVGFDLRAVSHNMHRSSSRSIQIESQ
jgi:hypothetical protein